ncbi:hypothetical protein MMALV_05367 [Candidatus Methanomethylophilus alvi Mx1201]|uniref:3-deoxy-D-manno-octulosonate 8-phosphate phosphatase n=1 Tax=Methanomethylophilus alvi (strain Mx1201) TaxID=1236689 RepID=U5Q1V4_METAX|nr:HAD hydrolase family protein [Methanomethylophilus alvi]AGY50141.1 hypothetical protein MMALV_05367 [Candidatus Methanomethylophilus alvi Mx1201]
MKQFSFLNNVELLIYDCDGVLTNNKVIVDECGKEYVVFSRADGYGISRIHEMGIKQVVISTESNPVVIQRCNKLKLAVLNNVSDKSIAVKEYCKSLDIDLKNVMFVGNDLNDLNAMNIVGYRGCPADAEPEVLSECNWISLKNGGDGVIRDLYRNICESRM